MPDRWDTKLKQMTLTSLKFFERCCAVGSGADVPSFNRQPQVYALALFRVHLRLTVKRALPMDVCASAAFNRKAFGVPYKSQAVLESLAKFILRTEESLAATRSARKTLCF